MEGARQNFKVRGVGGRQVPSWKLCLCIETDSGDYRGDWCGFDNTAPPPTPSWYLENEPPGGRAVSRPFTWKTCRRKESFNFIQTQNLKFERRSDDYRGAFQPVGKTWSCPGIRFQHHLSTNIKKLNQLWSTSTSGHQTSPDLNTNQQICEMIFLSKTRSFHTCYTFTRILLLIASI